MHRRGERPRALYTVEIHHTKTSPVIALADLDGAVSITNDAENIVRVLAKRRGIRGWRIVYRDSLGNWDELMHDGERFRGFGSLGGVTDIAGALAALELRPFAVIEDCEIRAARYLLEKPELLDELANVVVAVRPTLDGADVRASMLATVKQVAACPLVGKSSSRQGEHHA